MTKRILTADDEVSIVEVEAALLEDGGHEVLRASNGSRALQLTREHHPKLIVTDLMMPLMDGGALIRAVREEEGLANTTIGLMSAAGRARMKQAGADVVVPKPFNLDLLEDLPQRLLAEQA